MVAHRDYYFGIAVNCRSSVALRHHDHFCPFVGSFLATVGGAAKGMGAATTGPVRGGGPEYQLLRYVTVKPLLYGHPIEQSQDQDINYSGTLQLNLLFTITLVRGHRTRTSATQVCYSQTSSLRSPH